MKMVTVIPVVLQVALWVFIPAVNKRPVTWWHGYSHR